MPSIPGLVFGVIKKKNTFTTQFQTTLVALPIKWNCTCWQVIYCTNKHIQMSLWIICLDDKLLHKQHFYTCFTCGNCEQLNCTFISQGFYDNLPTAGLWMRSQPKQVRVPSPGCKWHHHFTEKVFTGWGTLSVNTNQRIDGAERY